MRHEIEYQTEHGSILKEIHVHSLPMSKEAAEREFYAFHEEIGGCKVKVLKIRQVA